MEPNIVFVNDKGIIEIHVIGDQTTHSVQAMGDEALRLAQLRLDAGQLVLILDNILQIGQVPPEGRRTVVEYGKKIEYKRLAMLGKGSMLRLGANLLIQAVGKGSQVRYFDDEVAAVAWLLS